ncbi:MAG: glycosyltransferase family 4 protein [Pirellulaceae bacterium]
MDPLTAGDRLTIALVSTQRLWQGGEEQAWQLAQGLRRGGHRCVIVALREAPFAQRLREAGFEVLGLAGKLPLPGRIWWLRRQLRQQAVEVVHCNDAHAIALGGLAAWRLPRVVTVAARRASFPIRSPARYRLLCDRVFCVSTYAAERCVEAGIPRALVRVIHDGVDPARMAGGDRDRGRRALGIAPDATLLLSVGSLVACKGHRDLLEALPAVRQQFPQVRLVIAGAGDQESQLRQRIGELQLQSTVQLPGYRDDVADLMQACDLFVFPSVDEGLGSTLIDAMLAGRPIVTTTAGGIPDLVGDPHLGQPEYAWAVEPADPVALARAICEALAHPEICAERVARARPRAEDLFTTDPMVEATVRAYWEAIRGMTNDE